MAVQALEAMPALRPAFDAEAVGSTINRVLRHFPEKMTDELQGLLREPPVYDDQHYLPCSRQQVEKLAKMRGTGLKIPLVKELMARYPIDFSETILPSDYGDSTTQELQALEEARLQVEAASRSDLIQKIAADDTHEKSSSGVNDPEILDAIKVTRGEADEKVAELLAQITSCLPTLRQRLIASCALTRMRLEVTAWVPESKHSPNTLHSYIQELTLLVKGLRSGSVIAKAAAEKLIPTIDENVGIHLGYHYSGMAYDQAQRLPEEIEGAYLEVLTRPEPQAKEQVIKEDTEPEPRLSVLSEYRAARYGQTAVEFDDTEVDAGKISESDHHHITLPTLKPERIIRTLEKLGVKITHGGKHIRATSPFNGHTSNIQSTVSNPVILGAKLKQMGISFEDFDGALRHHKRLAS